MNVPKTALALVIALAMIGLVAYVLGTISAPVEAERRAAAEQPAPTQ